jgi:cytochrome c peroxidase
MHFTIAFFRLRWDALLGVLLALGACKPPKEPVLTPVEQPYTLNLPAHFPQPPSPSSNQLTPTRIALGRRLFADPILSRDGSVSCLTCHLPTKGFTDGLAISIGIDNTLGFRNSMPIMNLAYQPNYFWDGGVRTLEAQVLVPIDAHFEMDLRVPEAVNRLRNHPDYPRLFQEAYGTEVNEAGLVRAISAFMRSLVSANAPYDRYLAGDPNAISESAKRGERLYFSEEAECFHCHGSAPFFSDFTFQNNGLYEVYEDKGRFNISNNPRDEGRFRVPSLRNLAYTAPYMHDGSLATLDEVLDHYIAGGKPHPNKSPFIIKLNFTEQERADLMAFLESLNDPSFIQTHSQNPDLQ